MDNIRVKYGDTWAPSHGGSGGDAHIFEVIMIRIMIMIMKMATNIRGDDILHVQ